MDVIPFLMENDRHSNSVCRQPDQSRKEMNCGLDVEPEIAFREGQKQKDNVRKLQLAILAAALAGAMSASATMVLVTNPGGEESRQSPGSEGFAFTTAAVLSNPVVTQLGIYDFGNMDLAEPHVVTLFDAGGENVLASATIPASSFTPADHWQWVNTAPVTLAPSTTYILVAYYGENNPDGFFFCSATLPAGFSLDNAVSGEGLGPPEQVEGSTGRGFFGPNLAFSTVPEPTTMIAGALLLLPFGASALRILRKNRAA